MFGFAKHFEDSQPSRFDTVAECAIGVLLVFAPLAFGSTQPWAQEIVVGLVALASLCVIGKLLFQPHHRFVWSPSYLLIVLFLLFCALQLVHLSPAALGVLSPATLKLKTSLLSDTSASNHSGVPTQISFYPAATVQQLRLIFVVAAVFVIVLNVYRSPAQIRRLLTLITFVGLAVALLAVEQNITGDTTVYGVVPAIHHNSGPFMNYGHFAQFMNLSIGAALGLLLMKITDLSRKYHDAESMLLAIRQPKHWIIWLTAGLCVLGPITILLSLSRMGMLSLLIAGGVTGLLLATRARGSGKSSLIAGFGILILACLLCGGFDLVYSRLATLRHVQTVAGSRLEVLRDMVPAFRMFPLFGSGLATHQFVFPMFDHSSLQRLTSHAENEYAQLLEECGGIGLLFAVLFIAIALIAYLKTAWRPKDSIQYVSYGLGFGLLATLIHSASDFGQHVPAIAILTATMIALLLTIAARPWQSARAISPASSTPITVHRFPWLLMTGRGIAGAAFVLAFVSILLFCDRARCADGHFAKAQLLAADLEKNGWKGSPDDYRAVLSHAVRASDLVPGDVTYRFWLNVYRWHAVTQTDSAYLDPRSLSPVVLGFAKRIVSELDKGRTLCPTYGPIVCEAGELKLFVLGQPEGADEIRTAYRLFPYDPTVSAIDGQLAVRRQDWSEADTAFRRYIEHGGSARMVIDCYLRAGQPHRAYAMAKTNRDDLNYLAGVLPSDPADRQLAAQCKNESAAMLIAQVQMPDASPQMLAEGAKVDEQQGKTAEAIALYRKALNLDYSQVQWHLELARALAAQKQYADAAREARVCLQLRPQLGEAQSLASEYSMRTNHAD